MVRFIKNETTFVIALIAALISALFNPPSKAWLDAIDFRTLALLFSLMGISEGLKASHFFDSVAYSIERKAGNTRRLSILLVMIVFISSMFFTNDVSLLIFVPFSMMILDMARVDEEHVAKVVVLETISANLGSMTTPVGNPQNLYICSFFNVDAAPFFRTILPYSAISLILVLALSFILLRRSHALESQNEGISVDSKKTALYIALLIVALLAVFRVIDWRMLFFAEAIILLIWDRKILLKIDYILLLTFVCFFIFSENMGNIEAVMNLLSSPMESHPIATSALVSQVISNVPAAILLSPFSDSFEGVLIGTDIGGLGTPIASLASLISLKFYMKRKGGKKERYMLLFLLWNFALLLALALFSLAV